MPNGDQIEWGTEFDPGQLIGAETLEDLIGMTGLLDDTGISASDWESDWGAYITPYNWQVEKLYGQDFLAQQEQAQSKAYGDVGAVTTGVGRAGFGTSYAGDIKREDVISNVGAGMKSARKAKTKAIAERRDDWVSR